jgi:hypothetical protein
MTPEALDPLIQARVLMAHTLRCVLQGHYRNPCQFCGVQVDDADSPAPSMR